MEHLQRPEVFILLQRLAVRAVERTRFIQQADLARQVKETTAETQMERERLAAAVQAQSE